MSCWCDELEESAGNLTIPFLEVSQRYRIGKILVPVDGSECSLKALEIAVELAEKHNSEICLVHIIPTYHLNWLLMPVEFTFLHEGIFIPSDLIQKMKREGERLIMSTLTLVQSAGIKSYARIGQGLPANEIVQIAIEEDANLIVIGSNNPDIFARLLFGSVSDAVVHKAPCPVLVVKFPQAESKMQKDDA